MFGAPSHLDTWDMKPESPAEIRGEFAPIASSVPGTFVCEHLPLLARMTDRFAQIRSVTHPDNVHTVAMHYMLTGVRHQRPKTNPQYAPDDFPCFGSVLRFLAEEQRVRGAQAGEMRGSRADRLSPVLPAAVSLNAPANQVSANKHIFPGFFSGFLGSAYDPLFVAQHANKPDFDPLAGVVDPKRLRARAHLAAAIDRYAAVAQTRQAQALETHFEQAFRLLTSPAARSAFNLGDEPHALREQYGSTPFGQGCLLARRLVEAGVSLVTVNWERDDAFWDTHSDNFNRHKKQLLPNLDCGFSALLDDLEQRGLLDETLVVWLAEFGRTPKINKQAGRDHWAACNSVLLAGAGIEGGQVYGASDQQAAYPIANPVSPEDLAATIYHLLGIDTRVVLPTPDGRHLPISQGEPIRALL
jgi:hypothetical protein